MENGGARGGAVGSKSASIDPDLQAIIDAWPSLPDAVKADILAMVNAETEEALSRHTPQGK